MSVVGTVVGTCGPGQSVFGATSAKKSGASRRVHRRRPVWSALPPLGQRAIDSTGAIETKPRQYHHHTATMPSSTRNATYHQREPPAPRQQKLSSRRKTVHRTDTPPTLSKRQSTLTQKDYVRTPHSSRREPVQVSSSDEEESEYEEAPRPKKKRKTSTTSKQKPQKPKRKAIGKSQSTLTQKWDWRTTQMALDSEESEEDLVMPEDDEPMGFFDEPPMQHSIGHVKDVGVVKQDEEVVETIESAKSSPRSMKTRNETSSEVERSSTRPTSADSGTHPQTPKRFTKTFVPSSETPSSLHKSQFAPQSQALHQRSPLKERSANISPVKQVSPLKSKVSFAGNDIKAMDETKVHDQPVGLWKATIAHTPKKNRERKFDRVTSIQESEQDEEMDLDDLSPLPYVQRDPFVSSKSLNTASMQRLSPVNEGCKEPSSQKDGRRREPIMSMRPSSRGSWKHDGVVPDSEESSLQTSSPSQPARGMATQVSATTAPDVSELSGDASNPVLPVPPAVEERNHNEGGSSDVDLSGRASEKSLELGEEFEQSHNDGHHLNSEVIDFAVDTREDENDENYMADEDEDESREADADYDDRYIQNTYDPVSAALDRDAARFGKTETQLEAEGFVDRFDQSYAQAGDTQNTAVGGEDIEIIPSSQPGHAEVDRPETHAGQHAAHKSDLDDSGYGSQHAANTTEADMVPSSQKREEAGATSLPSDPPDLPRTRQDSHMPSDPVDDTGYESLHPKSTKPKSTYPHPSQVSTQVDTQSESSRPNSAHDNQPQAKSASNWNEVFSSSPIPVPSSMARKSQRNQGNLETQGSAFMDWSLPPPPPLYSSQSVSKTGSSQRGRRGSGFE